MWDLPGPGIEPASPALADGFFTIEPPREALSLALNNRPPFPQISANSTSSSLFSFNIYLRIWLCWVFIASCGNLLLCCVGSVVLVQVLSRPKACGIFVPQPRIKPSSLALWGRFLNSFDSSNFWDALNNLSFLILSPPGHIHLLFFSYLFSHQPA